MNKTELIAVVAEQTGVTKKVTGEVLDALCKTVVDTVAKGDSLQLVGFGTFTFTDRPAKDTVNPITKQPMHVEAKRAPKFKPGKAFKDACNK